MNKRKIIISVAGIVILLCGFFISKLLSNTEKPLPASANSTNETKAVVRTSVVKNGAVKSMLSVTGRVIAMDRVDVFAEVSGVSQYGARPFKTGNTFRQGEILLKIDNTEFLSTLAASKSEFSRLLAQTLSDLKLDYPDVYPEWKAYLVNFDINATLPTLPEIKNEQLKFFLTGRNILSTYYNILQSEERLSKYVIRAPFSGTLTESNIDRGTLVRTGQQLGEFIRNGSFELEASVAYDQLKFLKQGMGIQFTDVRGNDEFKGSLVRINNKVDPNTQLVKVYFRLDDIRLKSGLYLKGEIETVTYENASELPIQSLVDDAFVLTINKGIAQKTPIKVMAQSSEKFIAIGIPEGAKVIIDKKNSAFAGTEVIEM